MRLRPWRFCSQLSQKRSNCTRGTWSLKRVPATHSRRLLLERNFRRTTDGFFTLTNQRLGSGNTLSGLRRQWKMEAFTLRHLWTWQTTTAWSVSVIVVIPCCCAVVAVVIVVAVVVVVAVLFYNFFFIFFLLYTIFFYKNRENFAEAQLFLIFCQKRGSIVLKLFLTLLW